MPDDGRTYIRVHDGMPDHPKVEALSDRAFRLLVETWCWCSRHLTDGRVPRATWQRRSTPKVRRELVDAGLVEDLGADGVFVHDYLVHQRSRAEVEEKAAERREAARVKSVKANHTRWHTGPEGTASPECELCPRGSRTEPNRTSPGSRQGVPRGVPGESVGSPKPDPPGESSGSPRGSHIGIGIGRGVVTLGGEALDPNAQNDQEPPLEAIFDPDEPRCARHAGIPPGQHVPACGECAEVRRIARKLLDDAETEVDQRRQAWRAEVEACAECDELGRIELANGSLQRHHPHPDDVRTAS